MDIDRIIQEATPDEAWYYKELEEESTERRKETVDVRSWCNWW